MNQSLLQNSIQHPTYLNLMIMMKRRRKSVGQSMNSALRGIIYHLYHT